MGREKAKLEETEAAWDRKAMAEDLRCSICSSHIIHSERDVYFTVGMCAHCAHIPTKDD